MNEKLIVGIIVLLSILMTLIFGWEYWIVGLSFGAGWFFRGCFYYEDEP